MLDDVIEAAIDILGDIVELIVSVRRRKKKSDCKPEQTKPKEPWTRSDQSVPWET